MLLAASQMTEEYFKAGGDWCHLQDSSAQQPPKALKFEEQRLELNGVAFAICSAGRRSIP